MKKTLALLLVGISTLTYSQIEEIADKKPRNNSIGLDYRFEGGVLPNIGITYRRFLANSPYTLRANFTIGSRDSYSYSYGFGYPYLGDNFLIFSTGDSATPIIGVSEVASQTNSYQRIEVGLEREKKIWKLNVISGVDIVLGHKYSSSYGRIAEAELQEIEKNGIKYNKYGVKGSDSTLPGSDLNYLSSDYNYLTAGVNARAGLKAEFNDRLYSTFFIGVRLQSQLLIRESFIYKNDLYKEHLPSRSGGSTFNFDSFASIGLHYKF